MSVVRKIVLGSVALLVNTYAIHGDQQVTHHPYDEIFRNTEGNWEYISLTYRAVVNGKSGKLSNLIVEGKEILAQGDDVPTGAILYEKSEPFTAAFVNLSWKESNVIFANDDNFGLWWWFFPDGIVFEYGINKAEAPAFLFALSNEIRHTEGAANVETCQLAALAGKRHWTIGTNAVRLLGTPKTPITVNAPAPIRVIKTWHGKPVHGVTVGYPQGKRMAGKIQIGRPAPEERLSVSVGFKTPFRGHVFPPSGNLVFDTPLTLRGEKPVDVAVVVLLEDFNTQRVLSRHAKKGRLTPGTESVLFWDIPWNRKGIFTASVRVRQPHGLLGTENVTFVYDLAGWKPALYCPEDFWEFWETKLASMRALPLDPKREIIEEKSGDTYRVFRVEITGHAGRRIAGTYGEPVREGKYPVMLGIHHSVENLMSSDVVFVAGEKEDDARYRRNIHDRHKSNLLHVFLDYIRWFDLVDHYGKADWDRSMAVSASRGGPVLIAAAALDKRLKLITMHVGTCNRYDWQVLHTSGWGPALAYRAPGQSVEDFIRQLSYFDASHFAERVEIPVAAEWGMRDGFSPINGNLCMWVYLKGPKFLHLRPFAGHNHPSPVFKNLTEELKNKLFKGEQIKQDNVKWLTYP